MAAPQDMDDIEARIEAAWTRCPLRRIDLDQELPDDGAEFLAVSYPLPGQERQTSHRAPGGTLYTLEGAACRLTLVAPKSRSVAPGFLRQAAADMEALRKAMRGRFGTDNGIRVHATSGPSDPQDDGVNWQITVMALYRRYGT